MTLKLYGPYRRADGRYHVIWYDTETRIRRTQSYPRFLMEQHLNRKLEDWEHVDHIDEDVTNNDISNLQLLTQRDNSIKSIPGAEKDVFVCPTCNKKFECKMNRYRHNQLKQGKAGPYCSRSCAGKMHN